MTPEAIIADVLNNLVTINKDRIVGYKEAIHVTQEDQVKIRRLFKEMVKQSEHFIKELKEKIRGLGAEVTDKTITTGLVYNTWMDIVYANSGEKTDVIHFCDQIEGTTLQAYDSALMKIKDLDKNIYDLILRQKEELINSRDVT
jgi:uncharacterized protein (TIGR02284 family)